MKYNVNELPHTIPFFEKKVDDTVMFRLNIMPSVPFFCHNELSRSKLAYMSDPENYLKLFLDRREFSNNQHAASRRG